MKRIVILLAILSFAVMANAQMRTTNLAPGNTYANVTTDYTLTNTTAQYWQVNTGIDAYTAQVWVVNLDSASGNHTNVALQLYGRYCSLDSWNAIGSAINWKGTTSDTTIVYLNAAENGYRQFKLLYTPTGTGTTTIDRQVFKLWKGLP